MSQTNTYRINKQPSNRQPRHSSRFSLLLTILLVAACIIAVIHFFTLSQIANSAKQNAIRDCANLIRTSDYNSFVLPKKGQEVGAIQLLDKVIPEQTAVVVPVYEKISQQLEDLYIYGCTLDAKKPELSLLFKKQGLEQGNIQLTKQNTISLGVQDASIDAKMSVFLPTEQQHIYHEFRWQDQGFHEILFPGFFPVLTRTEAEGLQEQANKNPNQSNRSPIEVVQEMIKSLLQWPEDSYQLILQHTEAESARVLLVRPADQLRATITLQRLVQGNQNGLWFVSEAKSEGFQLDTRSLTTEPLSLTGSSQNQGELTIHLFDHTLAPLSFTQIPETNWQKNRFTVFSLNMENITRQPGLLIIQQAPDKSKHTNGQLWISNLLLA